MKLSDISENNSSSTALGGAAVFTGDFDDVSNYSIITVMFDSDVDGSAALQFSTDGTNWDRQKIVPLDTIISTGSVHTLEVISRYFRVVFTNGSSAQGHFRLQVIYHETKSGFLTSSPDETISKINDVQLTRVSNEVLLDISRGLYADKAAIHKFGFNPTIPNGTFADVWAYGATDATYNWPTTSEAFRIQAGGNTNDTAAGTGARSIQIVFLDANGDEQQEQLATAGSSASASTSVTGRRIQRVFVDSAGTINGNNTGRIIIENETTNEIVATIEAGIGQTEMSMYTVPLGFTAYLKRAHIDVAVGTNKDANIRMWQRRDAYDISAPFGAKRLIRRWTEVQGEDSIKYESFPAFPALTDIWLEAKGNGATTEIDVDYDLICVRGDSSTVPQ